MTTEHSNETSIDRAALTQRAKALGLTLVKINGEPETHSLLNPRTSTIVAEGTDRDLGDWLDLQEKDFGATPEGSVEASEQLNGSAKELIEIFQGIDTIAHTAIHSDCGDYGITLEVVQREAQQGVGILYEIVAAAERAKS